MNEFVTPHLRSVLKIYQDSATKSLQGPGSSIVVHSSAMKKEIPSPDLRDEPVTPAPPPLQPPEIPQPVLSAADTGRSVLYETILEGKQIGCFLLGGEMRLCFPQVLNNVLMDFGLDQINRIFDELRIFCSQCSPEQLNQFKAAKILPEDVNTSGLITRTNAERLCSALLHHGERQLIAKNVISFRVIHRCFGKCDGICTPELYSYKEPACIRCVECNLMFSPQRFVCHVHSNQENSTLHWGFDSNNWRAYLQVSEDEENREKYATLLDELHGREQRDMVIAYSVQRDINNLKRKMDLQLRNSIYQCNPRCSIEKRTNKNHHASTPVMPAKVSTFEPTLINRLDCDRNDKQDLQRNNYLNETPDADIDIESIPLPASVLNRRPASFRHQHNGLSTAPTMYSTVRSSSKTRKNDLRSLTKKSTEQQNGGFKLVDILSGQKKKMDSKFHSLRLSKSKSDRKLTLETFTPFESFSIDADTYFDLVAKNQPIPLGELRDNVMLSNSKSLTSSTLADIQSVHASTCNLVQTLRASNQSMVSAGISSRSKDFTENRKFGYKCNSSSAMNLRSNSEQLNSSYYHFQNLDSEIDNNNGTLDSVLLPLHSGENHKPWKHRQCPSVSSSTSSSNSNIAKWNFSRHWLAITSILLIVGAAGVAVPLALRVASEASFEERLQAAYALLDNVPLIDGHNDLPYNIRKFVHNQLSDFDFDVDLKHVPPWSSSNWSHTDLQRLKNGRVSAQFWAAYVPCEAQYKDAVQLTLEQIDVIIRLTNKYSNDLTICTSAKDIVKAHEDNKICSLIGVEGGHSISGSLSVLRMLYMLGVRYMTLTSTCHTPWADSSNADAPKFDVKHNGLTEFGKRVIKEMNRLGMIVDLSHVSMATMRDAISTSEAPVIFSHSSAYELCNSSRNVQDSILKALAKNRGIIMLNFYSMFLSCGQNASVIDAVAHLNHIKQVAGADYVGIGAGYDGINYTPVGLEDASKYPVLFAELIGFGWTVEELTKLAGGNFLRVLNEVEAIRDRMVKEKVAPKEDIFANRFENPHKCQSY